MPSASRAPHPWSSAAPAERYSDYPAGRPPAVHSDPDLTPNLAIPIETYGHGNGSGGSHPPYADNPPPIRHQHQQQPTMSLPTPMPGLYDPYGNLLPDPLDSEPEDYPACRSQPRPHSYPFHYTDGDAHSDSQGEDDAEDIEARQSRPQGRHRHRESQHHLLAPTLTTGPVGYNPLINTTALPPAFGFGALPGQELVNIPYRPMEPRLKKWAKSEIKPEDVVLPLLLITFQTGVVDAATIKDFHTYTTGQTGNSILLVLAIFGRRPSNLLAGGLSVGGFALFSIIFGQLGNTYGHKTRGWILFSLSVQIVLLICNIILVSPALAGVLPQGGPFEWSVIFTGAAGGAGQMVMAINSGVSEINTVGLTGVYAALGSDPTLFSLLTKPHEVKRNRRLLFLLIFWGGAALGGAIATFSDMWISLILALECKVVALGMMMLSSAFEVPDGWAEEHAKVEREKGKGKGREEEEVDTWAD